MVCFFKPLTQTSYFLRFELNAKAKMPNTSANKTPAIMTTTGHNGYCKRNCTGIVAVEDCILCGATKTFNKGSPGNKFCKFCLKSSDKLSFCSYRVTSILAGIVTTLPIALNTSQVHGDTIKCEGIGT